MTKVTKPTAQSVVGVGELIRRYIADIDHVKGVLKEQKQMQKDAFQNDKEYHDEEEKAKEIKRKQNTIRTRLLKAPALEAVTAKIKELQEQSKDMQAALSGYLQEHVRQTGQTMIEGNDGEMYEMVPVYRLRKKREG